MKDADQILNDHSENPRNSSDQDISGDIFKARNPLCGDQVQVRLSIEAGTIRELQISLEGCAVAVAAGSIISEALKGQNVEAASILSTKIRKLILGEKVDLSGDILALGNISRFPMRHKCVLTTLDALEQALA